MTSRIPFARALGFDTRDPAALPRAPGLPFIGSSLALALQQYDFFDDAHARCGDIFEVDVGINSFVVVADPHAAEEVFITRPKNFDKGEAFWEGLRDILGNGLPVSEGDFWRRQRRLMNPQFRRTKIAAFRRTIASTVDEFLDELAELAAGRDSIDVSGWTQKLLSTLTTRLLLGGEFDKQRFETLRDALGVMLDDVVSGMLTRKLPPWVPIPGAEQFEAARASIHETILDVIQERRRSGHAGDDLLGMLLEATDGEQEMSDTQLRDEVITTYLAGYETTAWGLAWALWLLADHGEIVAQVQAEIDGSEDLMKAPLLDGCFREALRLYPPGPFVPRRAVVDERLLGYRIPAGTTVAVSPWLIHRNPRVWPDPLRFDPTRFATEDPHRPRLAWMPFGGGQRICIGKGLAMMEFKLALGKLLRRFTPVVGSDYRRSQPRLSTSLRARDGVWVRFVERGR